MAFRVRSSAIILVLALVLAGCAKSANTSAESQAMPKSAPMPESTVAIDATTAGRGLPMFALPAPRPSATADLTSQFDRSGGRSLGDMERQLRRALTRAGYGEVGFFQTKGGFALATRMERITRGGVPYAGDKRWQINAGGLIDLSQGVSLATLRSALGHADPGRYRIIIFVVGTEPVSTTGTGMRSDVAQIMVVQGPPALPSKFDEVPVSPDVAVSALIYEFDRPAIGQDPQLSIPSSVPGELQLERTGVIPFQR